MKGKSENGMSLVELMVCLCLISVFASVAVPYMTGVMAKAKLKNASRTVLLMFQQARMKAISESRYIGIRFEKAEDGDGIVLSFYRDGDGDGIMTADIKKGTDRKIKDSVRIMLEGVEFGILQGDMKDVPTSGGNISNPDDPIKFGKSNIVSFSPIGKSSSGSVYFRIRDRYMFTVKLYGGSAKMKEWEYDWDAAEWR